MEHRVSQNQTVKKSTSIVNFRGSLSGPELNLMTILIKAIKDAEYNYLYQLAEDKHAIDLKVAVPPEQLPNTYRFTLNDLSKLLHQSPRAVSAMLSAGKTSSKDSPIDKLMSKIITFGVGDEWEKEQLLGPSSYKKGVLSLQVLSNVKRAILDETAGYSAVEMGLYMKLSSPYDKRLLDFISQFKDGRPYSVNIDELEARFGVTVASFSDGFKGFRVTVLQRPIERIFKASEGVWRPTDPASKGYEVIKKGRNAVAVKFHVKYNLSAILSNSDNQAEHAERQQIALESHVAPNAREKRRELRMLRAMEDDLLAVLTPTQDDLSDLLDYKALAKKHGYRIPSNVQLRLDKIEQAFT